MFFDVKARQIVDYWVLIFHQESVTRIDWEKAREVTDQIAQLEELNPHLKEIDVDDIIVKKHTSTFVNTDIIPPYFKIAKVQAIDAEEKEIKLIIDPQLSLHFNVEMDVLSIKRGLLKLKS